MVFLQNVEAMVRATVMAMVMVMAMAMEMSIIIIMRKELLNE